MSPFLKSLRGQIAVDIIAELDMAGIAGADARIDARDTALIVIAISGQIRRAIGAGNACLSPFIPAANPMPLTGKVQYVHYSTR